MTTAMKFEVRDGDWATDLQNGLEEYMSGLYESVDAEEGTEEYEKGIDTESGIPFCACNVCEGREILSFLAPRIIKGYLDNKIGFVEVDTKEFEGRIIEVANFGAIEESPDAQSEHQEQ
jgi:hypothetical protein